MEEGKSIKRRTLLKALAGIPVLGIFAYEAIRKINFDKSKETRVIEELGLGIDRMIDEMIQAGHPAPQFEARPFTFKVTLRNVRQRPVSKWAESLNERQIKALGYLEEQNRITNRDYQQLCPDVTPETLRLDLSDMVDKGILLRIGAKKGTYYILK